MLVELYIFFMIVSIGLFITAFYTKQEILWTICLVLFAVLMYQSYNVEYYTYEWNEDMYAYEPVIISNSYPYLMGINLLFFVLSMILLIFDIFDKYGMRFARGGSGGI